MSDERRLVLSASALQITPAEHKAILEIRELFAARKFHHDPQCEADRPDGFNMNIVKEESECGTTCCIGGWMWEAMSRDRTTDAYSPAYYVNHACSQALKPLFHPFYNRRGRKIEEAEDYDIYYDEITPAAALKAIDSFLAKGDPDWLSACGARHLETAA